MNRGMTAKKIVKTLALVAVVAVLGHAALRSVERGSDQGACNIKIKMLREQAAKYCLASGEYSVTLADLIGAGALPRGFGCPNGGVYMGVDPASGELRENAFFYHKGRITSIKCSLHGSAE